MLITVPFLLSDPWLQSCSCCLGCLNAEGDVNARKNRLTQENVHTQQQQQQHDRIRQTNRRIIAGKDENLSCLHSEEHFPLATSRRPGLKRPDRQL